MVMKPKNAYKLFNAYMKMLVPTSYQNRNLHLIF